MSIRYSADFRRSRLVETTDNRVGLNFLGDFFIMIQNIVSCRPKDRVSQFRAAFVCSSCFSLQTIVNRFSFSKVVQPTFLVVGIRLCLFVLFLLFVRIFCGFIHPIFERISFFQLFRFVVTDLIFFLLFLVGVFEENPDSYSG